MTEEELAMLHHLVQITLEEAVCSTCIRAAQRMLTLLLEIGEPLPSSPPSPP